MATVRKKVKYYLFNSPSLYTSPVQVLVFIFTNIGTHNFWSKGQLVDFDENTPKFKNPTMKYKDPWLVKDDDPDCLKSLNIGFKLKNVAFRKQCEFVEENIEQILDADLTNTYFHEQIPDIHFLSDIYYDAPAFTFPDNIKPDWAKVLYDFFTFWLKSLDTKYGPAKDDNDPKDVQKARKAILTAIKRLHPFAHNGQTYEEYLVNRERNLKYIAKLWNSL